MKKIISVLMVLALCLCIFSSCGTGSGSEDLAGAHILMFKNTGNAYGTQMFDGFKRAIELAGGRPVFKSPSEPTVAAQVEMLDTLITQQVASITISPCGDTGYEEVFRRAKEAGIEIVSTDNVVAPEFRTTHVSDCDTQDIGSALTQSGVLIALGIDYPADGNLENAVKNALKDYNGKELKIGVLSSAIDTTAQNNWIACMKNELEKDFYKGKVSKELDIKYGNDVPTEATTQANAFVTENAVDVIVSPTTVGLAAAGQVLKSSSSKIKVTGLGLPHEMQSFMPASESDNAFDFVCPYMLLWDVVELGAAAGAAAIAAYKGDYDGKIGSTYTLEDKTFETIAADDGGTRVIALSPLIFHKGNMAEWVDKL